MQQRRLELVSGLYVRPTPAGAFHAARSPEHDGPGQLLTYLLSHESTPMLNPNQLVRLFGTSLDAALAIVVDAQERGFIEGDAEPRAARGGSLESVLPQLMPALSSEGKTLLVDAQGFVASSTGFDPEAAEALAALSADLGLLHDRHRRHFDDRVGLPTSAWALVDGAGNSQVGFWPLHIGNERFVLTIVGLPRLHQDAFCDLIWTLMLRYGTPAVAPVAPPTPTREWAAAPWLDAASPASPFANAQPANASINHNHFTSERYTTQQGANR